jgi:hypothetical protein
MNISGVFLRAVFKRRAPRPEPPAALAGHDAYAHAALDDGPQNVTLNGIDAWRCHAGIPDTTNMLIVAN